MNIIDFKGIFKTALLEVDTIDNPFDDYYTISFKIEKNIKWIPGEHGVFSIPDHKIEGKKWRAFSIASTPDEGFLLIGTRTGKNPSEFKKVLLNLNRGEKVKIRGPFGWFKLRTNTKPVVLIAGGVGITPIRSLIRSAVDKDLSVELIYSSSDHYLFEDFFNSTSSGNNNIKLHKISGREDTAELIRTISKSNNNGAYYYISGSMNFIKSVKKNLMSNGVKGSNIINDPFIGY